MPSRKNIIGSRKPKLIDIIKNKYKQKKPINKKAIKKPITKCLPDKIPSLTEKIKLSKLNGTQLKRHISYLRDNNYIKIRMIFPYGGKEEKQATKQEMIDYLGKEFPQFYDI